MIRFHRTFLPAAVFLIILFGPGCDDSSKTSFTPKPAKKQSFTPSDDTQSAKPQPSSGEKKKPLDKKQKKNKESSQPRGTPKSAADSGTASGESSSSSTGGTGETSPGSGKKPFFSSDKNEGGGTRNTGSGTGNYRPDGTRRKNVPADWFPTDIKKRPQPAQLEIWNRLLSALRNLIVARQVNFSPLGAEHTQLTELSANQYKAAGRCIVIEKSGNQMAYEFECVAKVTAYEATILSVQFHLRN